MKRPGRHRGFTFLELILAMAMVSMLALSLYASLRIGFRAKASAERAIGPSRAAEVATSLLCRDLESALPPTGILAGPFIGQVLTDGGATNSTLEFYCIGQGPDHPDPTGWGGIRRIELGVTTLPDGTPNVLVRRITSNLLAPVEVEPDQEVICRGVRVFSLQYWDGTMWQDNWDSTQLNNILPMAVQLTLAIDWPAQRTRTSADTTPTYQTTRIFTLPCYTEAADTSTTAASGATSTGGASPGGGASTGGASSGSGSRTSGGTSTGGSSRGGGR